MNYFSVYENDETNMIHRDTKEESLFLYDVCHGNMDNIQKNISEHRFRDHNGVGNLSSDPVLNLKYHMVITAGLITRICIQSGMEAEKAFRISDYYINQLDKATTEDMVELIHNDMILDFTGKMSLIKYENQITKPVKKCLNYIYTHITERITIKELAEHSKVSTSYLSREFHKEIGVSVSDFIRRRKIELSAEMLINSDQTILEIAHLLSFSSQSHYIQTFKSIVGMTPKEYRTRNL